jgi:hypothetical protein
MAGTILLGHVAAEHRTQGGIEVEEAGVEQRGGLVGDRDDLAERVFDEMDFGGSHRRGS